MAGIKGFYSTFVANCFFNALLLFTAMVLNIITIQALRKISSFPKPLKTLLLSLAVSDLGVGLLVQPLYIVHLVMNIELDSNKCCKVEKNCSFSVWVFSLCISSFALNKILENVLGITNTTIGSVCLTTTGLIYCKIYSIVRHHTNQIHALQLQPVGQNQNGELANAARQKKTALATFYVYVVFVVCFLPFVCVNTAYRIYGETELRLHLLYYSTTLMYLNSSLNPLVYCWKMRNIRQAVISVFRNIFQGQ